MVIDLYLYCNILYLLKILSYLFNIVLYLLFIILSGLPLPPFFNISGSGSYSYFLLTVKATSDNFYFFDLSLIKVVVFKSLKNLNTSVKIT